jgi:hypothetical protein
MIDLEKLKEHLDSLSESEIEDLRKLFADKRPKGWLSIDEHLPMMLAEDISRGYSVYKVRYSDGAEDITKVADHSVWFYEAKEAGITHWFNE